MFFNRKPKAPAVPADWPSPYHNKCNQPNCRYPNPPQAAKGVYICKGVPGGFFCEGTYKVSNVKAQEATLYYKEISRRTAEAALRSEEERKRREVDWKRSEMAKRRRGKEEQEERLREERVRQGYGQRVHVLGGVEIRQVKQHVRPDPRSGAVHRPSQAQIEEEYITDRKMMQMYPERRIRPRWI
ncbi:hypothetical protein SERLADRAFT_415894 [Serpula lacrymans var. lacrymans S7.9]|uniref:Uncharacterized protein n=1 Tax=Serpula lacrymans var. lacrymans (strain S7.9) TaxID=578457 RepID=F8NWM7_SERL9|nr:uncharacterized protein SERLADRAFT_415894 [Serpula lacrymans var. lacrymans S7.9]EGO25051.1 hypothetical protein SERLADRAFT_415894 [Serpula lacrymans var. lacrymans S7.9]